MNKKQIVIEVVEHPLIKSIKKLNFTKPRTLSQMIARSLEEVLSEDTEQDKTPEKLSDLFGSPQTLQDLLDSEPEGEQQPTGDNSSEPKTSEQMEGPLQTATVKLAKKAGVEKVSDYNLLPHREYYQAVFFDQKPPKDAFLDRFNSGEGLTDQVVKRLVSEIPKILKQTPSDDAEKIAQEMLKGLLEAIQETQAKTAPLPDGVKPALERVIALLKDENYTELLTAIQQLKMLFAKQLAENNLQEAEEAPAQLLLKMLDSIQKGEDVDASALFITVSNLENQVKAKLEEPKEPEKEPEPETETQPEEPEEKSDKLKSDYINAFQSFRDGFNKAQTLRDQSALLHRYYRIIKILSGKDVPKFGEQAKAYVKTLGENESKEGKSDIIVTSNVVLRHMDKIEDILDAYKEQTEKGTVGSNRLFLKYGEGNPKKFLMKILGITFKDINALIATLQKELKPKITKGAADKSTIKELTEQEKEESIEDIIDIVTNAYEAILPEGEKILVSFQQTAKGELREDNGSIKAQAERIYNLIQPITKYFPSINPFGTNYGHDDVLNDFRATTKGLVSLVTQINRYAKDGDINRSVGRSALQKLTEIKDFLKERFGISDTAKKADKIGSLTQTEQGQGYKPFDHTISKSTFRLPSAPDGLEPEEELDMSDPESPRDPPHFLAQIPTPPEDRESVEELPSKRQLEGERNKQGREFAIYLQDTGNPKVPEWGNTIYPPWLFLSMFVRYWTFLKNPINVDLDEAKRGRRSNKPKDLPAKISAIIGVDAYNKIEKDYKRVAPIQGLASVSSTTMSKNKINPFKVFQITMSLIGQLLDSGKTSQIMKDFLENGKIDIPKEEESIEERIASKLKPIIERMLNG